MWNIWPKFRFKYKGSLKNIVLSIYESVDDINFSYVISQKSTGIRIQALKGQKSARYSYQDVNTNTNNLE